MKIGIIGGGFMGDSYSDEYRTFGPVLDHGVDRGTKSDLSSLAWCRFGLAGLSSFATERF